MHIPDLLVLGATGRIGGILRHFWRQSGAGPNVMWQSRRERAEQQPGWCRLDPLQDPAALAAAAGGRAAILCLAGVVPGRGGDFRDNSALAEAAIRAGAETSARVILSSTAAVYGGQGGALSEETALDPISDYGRSKAEMERAAAALGAMEKISGRGDVHQVSLGSKKVTLIDEAYNANPESMRAAIAALGLYPGRKVAVLGDMSNFMPKNDT